MDGVTEGERPRGVVPRGGDGGKSREENMGLRTVGAVTGGLQRMKQSLPQRDVECEKMQRVCSPASRTSTAAASATCIHARRATVAPPWLSMKQGPGFSQM